MLNNAPSGVCYGPTRKEQMADSSGAFTTTFIVRRNIIESGSPVDCASAPETCGIVAGDPRIAVATLTFDPSVPANGPHYSPREMHSSSAPVDGRHPHQYGSSHAELPR